MSPSYKRKSSKSSSKRSNLSKSKKHLLCSKNDDESSSAVSPATSACCSATVDGGETAELCCNSGNSCSTPKAERYRIPEVSTCPPAPKKRRLRNASFSLRRTSLPFFAHPDIELFFYFALRGIPA